MPTEVLEPNSCSKTMYGYGTGTCGSCSASAETCDCEATSSCDAGSNEKVGVTFKNFDSPSQQPNWTSAKLVATYKLYKRDGDDDDSCDIERMYLRYTKNGTDWFYFDGFYKTASGSHQTGTAYATISNPTSVDVSKIQVRAYARAVCCQPCVGQDECCYRPPEMSHDFCWCVASPCVGCTGGADCSPGAC